MRYGEGEDLDFRPPQLTADGALASLEAMAGELRIEAHERHLHDHLNSILDDRHKEIASVQSHAESALQQLAAVREQEQLQLTRRAEALQRDFRESIAELEHRYALQMESLKRDMLAKIAETKAACEAKIEAKAIELAEELETADREEEENVYHQGRGLHLRRKVPGERAGRSLLRQHTVSGTWQDTNLEPVKESVTASNGPGNGPGHRPCACRQAYRTASSMRPLRVGDLLDSDDDDPY